MKKEQKNKFRAEISERFASLLEKEGLQWKKGWMDEVSPVNGATNRQYTGINFVNLYLTALEKGYKDPRWYTFNQISKLNEQRSATEKYLIKKDSHGTKVEYFTVYDKETGEYIDFTERNRILSKIPKKDQDPNRFSYITKYFTVFNAEQILNLPSYIEQERSKINETKLVKTLSQNMNVPIFESGDEAYYSLKEDVIHLPDRSKFLSQHEYDYTALHELAHSTGHPDRLNRNLQNEFGSDEYAFEELIAEMSSCFMGINLKNNEIPTEHLQNHEAYIQNWVTMIRDNAEILPKAIAEAQKVSDYMEQQAEITPERESTSLSVPISSVKTFQDQDTKTLFLKLINNSDIHPKLSSQPKENQNIERE